MQPRHSEDLRWWHDGQRWLPALSPDGTRWFDGSRWRPNRRRSARPCLVAGVILAATWPLVMLAVFVETISATEDPGQQPGEWEVVLGGLWGTWLGVAAPLCVAGALLWSYRPIAKAPEAGGDSLSAARAI